jgi:hypothetical protein
MQWRWQFYTYGYAIMLGSSGKAEFLEKKRLA